MFKQKYYFDLMRKYVVLFGSLFNDIYIDRVDNDGNVVNTLKIPLSYGRKDRYIQRLIENPDLQRPINFTLPRMAFVVDSWTYDKSRKTNTQNKRAVGTISTNTLNVQNDPVPWDINFTLSILTRNADDGHRIIEQILPYFQPEVTTTLKLVPDMDVSRNVPIILQSVEMKDEYEGNLDSTDQLITWDITFVMKGWFYGAIAGKGVIKEVDIHFWPSFEALNSVESIDIKPGLTANGQPTSNSSASIPYTSIKPTDDWGFITAYTGVE